MSYTRRAQPRRHTTDDVANPPQGVTGRCVATVPHLHRISRNRLTGPRLARRAARPRPHGVCAANSVDTNPARDSRFLLAQPAASQRDDRCLFKSRRPQILAESPGSVGGYEGGLSVPLNVGVSSASLVALSGRHREQANCRTRTARRAPSECGRGFCEVDALSELTTSSARRAALLHADRRAPTVLKFGGTSVADAAGFARVADILRAPGGGDPWSWYQRSPR